MGRLQDCKRELHTLLQEERLAWATLLIFLNKQDIPGALPKEAIAEVLDVDKLRCGGRRHVNLMACSAVTGDGLLAGVSWIVDDISSRVYMSR